MCCTSYEVTNCVASHQLLLTFLAMSALTSNLGLSTFQPKPTASLCSSANADAYHMSFFGTQPRMTHLGSARGFYSLVQGCARERSSPGCSHTSILPDLQPTP